MKGLRVFLKHPLSLRVFTRKSANYCWRTSSECSDAIGTTHWRWRRLAQARSPSCDTLEKARASITLVKKSKSKLSHMPADPEGPCAGGCPPHAVSRAGSNAHVMKTTCVVCGHKTSTTGPAREPTQSHEACPHRRTDNCNSTCSVHRVYCSDSCTTIEKVPKQLWKQQQGLAEQVQQSPLRQQDLTRRQLEECNFTKFVAGEVGFFKHMDKFLVKVDIVTSTELSSFLEVDPVMNLILLLGHPLQLPQRYRLKKPQDV